MILHVSNTGNDETADGSESNPFKTLKACILYAHTIIATTLDYVEIRFLSDYQETESLCFNNPNGHFKISGNGHSVVLSHIRTVCGSLRLENLTIREREGEVNENLLYSTVGRIIVLQNIKMESLTDSTLKRFVAIGEKTQFFIIGTFEAENKSPSTFNEVFLIRDNAAFYCNNGSSMMQFKGAFNRIYYLYHVGQLLHVSSTQQADKENILCFKATSGSIIGTSGFGNAFVQGTLNGEDDGTCHFI